MLSLQNATIATARWLAAAHIPPITADSLGNTALHSAASGGLTDVLAVMLKHELQRLGWSVQNAFSQNIKELPSVSPQIAAKLKQQLDAVNREGRTAMHYAASAGHLPVLVLLHAYGAGLDLPDRYGVTVRHILQAPGPVSASDALQYFGIQQRLVKHIDRLQHPGAEAHKEIPWPRGWPAGNGGWNETRLSGYETDSECQVDQYWADEIDGNGVFRASMAEGRPILIRGLLQTWLPGVVSQYTKKRLSASATSVESNSKTGQLFLGDIPVQVSEIPYAEKFGARYVQS